MKKYLLFSLLAAFLTVHTLLAQTPVVLKNIMDKISPDAIKGHMTFLSDDLLEGRLPGTRGFAIGSKYMEAQFIALGLEPGFHDTSYIQPVPFKGARVEPAQCSFTLINNGKEEKLDYGRQFTVSPYFAAESSSVTAPLVFVGYGISAPEFNYDDYKNIDVKGKIVVYLSDARQNFPTSERAYFTTADVKYNEAIKRGAVGVITFALPTGTGRRTGAGGGAARPRLTYKWVSPQLDVANSYPALKAVAQINNQSLDKLFVNAPVTLEKLAELAKDGKSESFPLNLSASIKVTTQSKIIQTSNLLGVIEGSDPKLKNEYVVYSAHLDHLGIGNPVRGDSIYNGAHDDASGMAILLEIAKAYKSLPVPPKRSVVFAVVTGEEMGLLGSDYFINNMPMNGKVVANLAIDMPFFFHPVLDIVPYGADHSSLGKQTEQAAKMLNLKISPDPFPEQVVFIRSDHYSFIKKGIPALFIKSGFMTVPTDTVDRSKSDVAWRSTTYHTVRDNMHQAFDFKAATMHVKVNFLIGYLVCNDVASPTWNKGDFFGGRFGR